MGNLQGGDSTLRHRQNENRSATADSPGRRFRSLLQHPGALLLPGAYDALSATILEQIGFPAVYMSGSAVTSSLLGEPDMGLLSLTEMVDQARRIVNAVETPVICDADTGYGNALNVRRTVREYEAAGVAGIHLEDQVFPKRCGHFEGKAVIPTVDMAKKLEAALDSRRDPDFVVIARTDARAVEGLDGAIRRAREYQHVGADMLFIEALRSADEMRRVNDVFGDIPLFVNVVEGGKTPQLPFAEYEALGYRVVLYPTASIRVVMKALNGLASHLHEHRSTEGWLDHLVAFDERNEITGLAAVQELEKRYAVPKDAEAS